MRRGLGQKGAEELSTGLGQAWKVGAGSETDTEESDLRPKGPFYILARSHTVSRPPWLPSREGPAFAAEAV